MAILAARADIATLASYDPPGVDYCTGETPLYQQMTLKSEGYHDAMQLKVFFN
jgi:hypothetical protein